MHKASQVKVKLPIHQADPFSERENLQKFQLNGALHASHLHNKRPEGGDDWHCWLIVAQDAVSLRRKCDSSVYSAFPLTVSASMVGIASG